MTNSMTDALSSLARCMPRIVARAELSEYRVQKSAYRIQYLTDQLTSKGNNPDHDIGLPSSWSELADWSDNKLAGRLVLTPSADRGTRKPLYQDFETRLNVSCGSQRTAGIKGLTAVGAT